jgi:hypothetical protein
MPESLRPDALGKTLMQSQLTRKDLTVTQVFWALTPKTQPETVSGAGLTVPDTKIRISTPPEIAGPAVLHLRRVQS